MSRSVDLHFAVAEVPYDYHFAIGAGYLQLSKHTLNDGDYYHTGTFFDPRGIVDVYRQEDHTRISVCVGGYGYHRSWNKAYGDRTLARLCRAFLTDIVGLP